MDKKSVLLGGIFGGIGLAFVPAIFMERGIFTTLLKYAGFGVIFIAVVIFIGWDVIMKRSMANKDPYMAEINRKLKHGEITPEEAFKFESKKLDQEIERVAKTVKLEQKKAQIRKLKGQGGSGGGGFGGIAQAVVGGSPAQKTKKLPDVFGNLAGVIGPPAPQQQKNQQQQARKPQKRRHDDDEYVVVSKRDLRNMKSSPRKNLKKKRFDSSPRNSYDNLKDMF